MRNILVANYDDSGEDVMVMNTTLLVEELEQGLVKQGQAFTEVYEVPQEEVRLYIYEPLFADEKFDASVRNKLNT